MSFRRRRSRIGPAFQAIIPRRLSEQEKLALTKLYSYEQSLAEHCLTMSSLSGTSSSSSKQPRASTPTPYSTQDTSIDHKVDARCLDASKSRKPPDFDYTQYVQQCQLPFGAQTQRKLKKFQIDSQLRLSPLVDQFESLCAHSHAAATPQTRHARGSTARQTPSRCLRPARSKRLCRPFLPLRTLLPSLRDTFRRPLHLRTRIQTTGNRFRRFQHSRM